MDRPAKAGEKFSLKAEAATSRSAHVTIDGNQQPAGSESMEVKATGTIEVIAVTAKAGNIREFRFTAEEFTIDRGMGKETPLKAGAVVVLKANDEDEEADLGRVTVTVDGSEADELVERALLAALPGVTLHEESDDMTFGTGAARSVGDSWKCDPTAVAKYFERTGGVSVDAAGTSAKTRVVKKTDEGGVPAIVIGGSVQLKITGAPGLPEKAEVQSGSVDLEILTTFPLDTSLPPTLQKVVSDRAIELTAPVRGGKKMNLRSSERMERKMIWKKL